MDKKLYIATAIPYVNGRPHIGHALDYLIADIWARYQKQNGNEVRFSVGTDEHGNKIAAKAAENNLTPQQYVDQMYVGFEEFIKKVGAGYTDFIRTSNENHKLAVQYIWQKLTPYIYKSNYEGWYCVGCEAFVSDKEANINSGVCPDHKVAYQRLSEENYYLKTSVFTDQVRQAIESNQMAIVPEYRKKEFLELMRDGLMDVSISRPRKNLSWGVTIPNDPEHVMYVWIDALANYLTVLGYPNNPTWQEYWPTDVQVMGKDILRFHAGIWPAMLLGLGLELPRKLLVHGMISSNGTKMGKSLGNVVDPSEVIDVYGLDAFRYYFSRHIPTQDNGDFSWEKFENAYNGELANDLGNLISRVAGMITRYQSGVIGEIPQREHDMNAYHEAMNNMEFNKAMDEVWLMVRGLNQYIENIKPWEIAKNIKTDVEASAHLSEVLALAAGNLLQIGDLLVPFLPNAASRIQAIFDGGSITQFESVLFPKIYKHTPDPTLKIK